jgi:hypothetical protein
MAELETRPHDGDVEAFLSSVDMDVLGGGSDG